MLYQLKRKIELPISVEQAWEFFSDPNNLKAMTPSWLDMQITSDVPPKMYTGLILSYKVHPLLSIPLTWVTEIAHVNEPFFFVDEQRAGPYRMWHHQHRFQETTRGVLVEDIVDYIMPFRFLGSLFHDLFVKKKLEEIFEYRAQVLKELFGVITDSEENAGARSDKSQL